MASIQCKNCKYGIHYHGEPSGIEYVLIECHDLEKMIASKFDPKNKEIDSQTGYPKLFRTDTIAEDFPDMIKKFWKCPECGCLIFFDKNGRVLNVYKPVTDYNPDVKESALTAICFDDYQWDEITESSIPNSQLADKLSDYSTITIGDMEVTLLDAKGLVIQQYEKIT